MKDRESARDIVQSAFEVLWEKKSEVDTEKAKSFLFTVAYRKMIDDLRKRSKTIYPKDMPDSIASTTENQSIDLKKILHAALDKLPAIQKQLVLLRDYEGYSYAELAKISGLNEGQVKVNLFRARTSLKSTLVTIHHTI